jgi:hypothetical protein
LISLISDLRFSKNYNGDWKNLEKLDMTAGHLKRMKINQKKKINNQVV